MLELTPHQLSVLKQAVLAELKRAGTHRATITYDGAGGFASLDSMSLFGENGASLEFPVHAPSPVQLEAKTLSWTSLQFMLMDFAMTTITRHHVDDREYNPYGTITIDLEAESVSIEMTSLQPNSRTVEV